MEAAFYVGREVILNPSSPGDKERCLGKRGDGRIGTVEGVRQDGRLLIKSSGMTSSYSKIELSVVVVPAPVQNNAASLDLKAALDGKIKVAWTFFQKTEVFEDTLIAVRFSEEERVNIDTNVENKARGVRKVTLINSLLSSIETEKGKLKSLIEKARTRRSKNVDKKRFADDKKIAYRAVLDELDASIDKIKSIVTTAKSKKDENSYLELIINRSRITFGGKTRRNRRNRRSTQKTVKALLKH